MTETDDEKRARLLTAAWWSTSEAAFMVKRDKTTINEWIADGKLTTLKIGARRYIRPADAREVSTEHARRARA